MATITDILHKESVSMAADIAVLIGILNKIIIFNKPNKVFTLPKRL
jgi:hypothetical protein